MTPAMLGAMADIRLELLLPLDVLPTWTRCCPLSPLDVANTDGSTVAVFCYKTQEHKWSARNRCLYRARKTRPTVFVCAVVANVSGVWGETSCRADDVRKTRAKPGAGTWTLHVLAVWSQLMVTVETEPCKRPSTSYIAPKVYNADKV